MNNGRKHLSPFQSALRQFRRNRVGMLSLWVLALLYLSAIFADFLSPYSYKNEDRGYSHCPPMEIRIIDAKGRLTAPFVYGAYLTFDKYSKRIYERDPLKVYPVKLFVRGDAYKMIGLFPTDIHLFGVDAPGRLHLWGADSRGRDLFSRILYGGRISLSIGLFGVIISFAIGLLVGGIAGYYGGRVDNVLMRLAEMVMMTPGFYLMLALRAAFPPNLSSWQVYLFIIVIFSFIGWAGLARVIRGMSISLRERDYVLAAKAIGLSDISIILRHILPHTVSYSIVAIMLRIPGYILGEATLSLLGLGIQDPFASWGNLLSEAMGIVQIQFAPWILLPGFFIFVTVVCFNVVGDGLRDCLDPLLKQESVV